METEKTVNKGNALAEYISGFDYGTVIHYQDIEIITKEKRGASRYYNSIYKAKNILESNKKVENVGNYEKVMKDSKKDTKVDNMSANDDKANSNQIGSKDSDSSTTDQSAADKPESN